MAYQWEGNLEDKTGYMTIGDRKIRLESFEDYHAIAQEFNRRYEKGQLVAKNTIQLHMNHYINEVME